MNEKTLYKTNEYISFIKDNGFKVVIDKNPDALKIAKINKMIEYKKALFTSLHSLFN